MMPMRDRYKDDPTFRAMVDIFLNLMETNPVTPTEVREAAMLAQLMHEDRHPRPVIFTLPDFLNRKV
jgi:hypothetical protein